MKKTVIFFCAIMLVAMNSSCSKKKYDSFATLYGMINDSETGESLGGASVVLSPGGKTKTTGSDGLYEFQELDPQQYTITVQKAGYQTNRKTVTAVVGEKTEANIPLTKSN